MTGGDIVAPPGGQTVWRRRRHWTLFIHHQPIRSQPKDAAMTQQPSTPGEQRRGRFQTCPPTLAAGEGVNLNLSFVKGEGEAKGAPRPTIKTNLRTRPADQLNTPLRSSNLPEAPQQHPHTDADCQPTLNAQTHSAPNHTDHAGSRYLRPSSLTSGSKLPPTPSLQPPYPGRKAPQPPQTSIGSAVLTQFRDARYAFATAPRFISIEIVPPRNQTAERRRTHNLAYRTDNVPDALVLQLLWKCSLLMEIIALAVAPLLHHLVAARRRDTVDVRQIDAHPMQPVSQHGFRLTAMDVQELRIQQLLPLEVGISFASRDDETIKRVDLRKMSHRRLLTSIKRTPAARNRRLTNIRPALSHLNRRVSVPARLVCRSQTAPLSQGIPRQSKKSTDYKRPSGVRRSN